MVKITKIRLYDRMLLLGPPGIGKTERIYQLAIKEAEMLNKKFVDLRNASDDEIMRIFENPEEYYVFIRIIATHIFPEDVQYPEKNKELKLVEFLPPKMIRILTLPGIHGVLFIDEITNVQRDDQLSMYYSIILEKEMGFDIKLSKNIKIVLAGNPTSWSEVARTLPKPIRAGRVITIMVDPSTIDEWINYMNRVYNDEWETLCGAYLKQYPNDLLKDNEDEERGVASPRTWTMLCKTIYDMQKNGDPEELIEDVILNSLPKDVGIKFYAILKKRVELDRILNMLSQHPEKFNELEIDYKLLVIDAISKQPLNVMKQKYSKLLEYLLDSDREMIVLMIELMPKEKRVAFMRTFNNIADKLIDILKDYIS